MNSNLSLLDPERLTRAAEGMISNHGKDALEEAKRRLETLRFSGCDAAADIWERICQLIQVRVGSLEMPIAIPARCRLRGRDNPVDPQKPASDGTVVCLYCGASEAYRDFERLVLSDRVIGPSATANRSRLEISRS